jgi:hypothetical protein
VALASTPDEYESEISALLKKREVGPSAARSLRMTSESWDAKVVEIERLLSRASRS